MAANSGIPRIASRNSAGMSKHLRTFLREVELTDPAVAMSPGFLMAKAAADGKFPPVTDADRMLLACQKAAVRAADERKRAPQPQLELPA